MRNLFIVLAKVVGLLQVATAINYLYYLNGFFAETVHNNGNWLEKLGTNYMFIAATCMGIGLVLGLAWVLLFRTIWIADRLGLPDDKMDLPEPNLLLNVGIKLLGLFVLVGTIPNLINVMIDSRAYHPDTTVSYFWNRIFPIALKVVFGVVLVIKTTKIIELISRDAKPKEIASA